MADGKTSETPRGLGDFIFTMEKTKEQQLNKARADLEKVNVDWEKAKVDWKKAIEKATDDYWKAYNKIMGSKKQQ